ncbi:FMN-binding negative transcriptional regulator [Methylocapsa sp. S129]|uniref:FMN-binding negative transcriptional regulator n=1 Tax=Methylocapsa sp. S129 TaxID=1641869 RepID=UPI00131A6145|nr:FMN-binding negative transcriptional regulator [Methylocapsa sp. S129]
MYQPLLHRQEHLEAQHALIRSHPLGLLISHGAHGLEANSIPFLIDAQASRFGTLQAHMARANGQWRNLSEASDVLVIFQGADHYITPAWYETKRETGKVVPTWNYVMVQARGRPRVIDDAAWLRVQIEALTNRHESARSAPWAVGDAPEAFIDMQIKAIIGVEIEITDIAGKWKVSQNRPAADRVGVVAGLEELGDEASRTMASIVRETAPKG